MTTTSTRTSQGQRRVDKYLRFRSKKYLLKTVSELLPEPAPQRNLSGVGQACEPIRAQQVSKVRFDAHCAQDSTSALTDLHLDACFSALHNFSAMRPIGACLT
jgi:hypothetical protein